MFQKVVIAVLCDEAGKELYENCADFFDFDKFKIRADEAFLQNQLLFYNEHLDAWSMGDSFDRFLYPKSKLRSLSGGCSTIYAINRRHLKLQHAPRDEEERFLKSTLASARRFYWRASSDSYLFMLRKVFG